MPDSRRIPWWLAALVAVVGLVALYAGPLRTGFLNDDFLFLEQARAHALPGSLVELGALGNYYRPLSRQLYFAALTPIAGGNPGVFHAVNFALFLGALALLLDLLLALVSPAAAMAGALYLALLPLERVNLIWISCSQDLLALVGTLACVALWRRGRVRATTIAALAAFASKEAAWPLPLALLAWDVAIARRPLAAALRRAAPVALVAALWCGLSYALHARDLPAAALLHWRPDYFLAGYAHQVQSLLGIDHPTGFAAALFASAPDLLALVLLGALALWLPRGPAAADAGPATAPIHGAAPRAIAGFAFAWLIAFGLVTGPVASSWSAYFYTLSAVGGALFVALACRGLGRFGWVALTAALLWLNAAGAATRAFAVAPSPWTWTSHLTSFYFTRGAALTDTLSRQLRRLEPSPEPGTRMFFATLPVFAGFQMGNGALVRALYRDPSLESHFYSTYSESTADEHPARFLYWDGRELQSLYGDRTRDPLFQVGTDLLLLDRPAGASFAFRRGLASGGASEDHLYWLGWAELWSGHREAAERAWTAWGAADDSAGWNERLRRVQGIHLTTSDTLAMQRLLLEAIKKGMGRPEGHATLGQLLIARSPKYAMLELDVATRLDPRDLASRRALALGLASAHLDAQALAQIAAYRRAAPDGTLDPELAALERSLEHRTGAQGVVEF